MTYPTPTLPFSRLPAFVALLLLLVSSWLPVSAQTIPPRPNPPRLVNDLAGMMSADEVARLERKLVAYDDSTSSQIAVVTVPSLDGDEIANYAQQLYESWGIGRKGKNNGILVLVAAQERRARIQTGYGLEGAVPDALAKRIISNTIVPAFKQERYYEGLNTATDELIALAKGEYKADPQDQRRNRDSSGSGIPFWLIILALVLFWFLIRRGGGGGRGGRRSRSRGGMFIPPVIFGDFSGGRGTFGGGGGGGFGGGGFGGFGGGSSGGGGASGSW